MAWALIFFHPKSIEFFLFEGNLHVGQEFRQVRCPTVFDISIEQHSTHENTTQWSKQEGNKPCPMVGAIMLALELPHTKELSKTKA